MGKSWDCVQMILMNPSRIIMQTKQNKLEKIYVHILSNILYYQTLTHWGRVTHICVGNLTIIGSDNGLSPGRRQAITWTNFGILLIGPLGTNFSEILIEIHTFSFKNIHLKMSSGKWRPFCFGLNVLIPIQLHVWSGHSPAMIKIECVQIFTNKWQCFFPDEFISLKTLLIHSHLYTVPMTILYIHSKHSDGHWLTQLG